MNSEWREKFVYPFLGIATITTIIYLNFNDQFNFEFPIVFWQKKMGFVGVNSTHFVIINKHDHDQLMYVNGWNSYWLMEESVWGPSRSKVSKMLKKGAEMGLNVCRTWGFSDGPRPTSLQISPGVFNERVLKVFSFSVWFLFILFERQICRIWFGDLIFYNGLERKRKERKGMKWKGIGSVGLRGKGRMRRTNLSTFREIFIVI